jgi:hypothetical protein
MLGKLGKLGMMGVCLGAGEVERGVDAGTGVFVGSAMAVLILLHSIQ